MSDIVVDPDHLRTMADDLERQAERLSERRQALLEEVISCRRDATDMRQRADMIERTVDRRVVVRMRHPRQVTPRELDRIAETVKRLEPTTTARIAEEESITENQARDRLKRLEKDRRVVRSGAGSGIRWHSPDYEAVPVNAQSYSEWVRDVGFELGTFEIADVKATGLSDATVRRWVAYWVERGAFERLDVDGKALFAVKKHETAPVNRERRVTPEAQAPTMRVVTAGAVAGTGKAAGERGLDPQVRALIGDARAAGAEVCKTQGNHWQVRKGGKVIGSLPGTPSDFRSIPNARAELRRNGLKV